MIIWLDIKETSRNKRFLLFTLIFPLAWYSMMISMAKSSGFFTISNAYLWVSAACAIGIAGNAVVTFSKKISHTRKFYQLQAHTSNYSMRRWLMDQMAVQIILNFAICVVIIVAGLLMKSLAFNLNIATMLILFSLMGIYLSAIGFLLGIFVDSRTLDALSMPLSMVFGMLMVRLDTWLSGNVIVAITTIQKFFPGYYLFGIVQKMILKQNFSNEFLKFLLSCSLMVIPFMVIVIVQHKKHVPSLSAYEVTQ
ncbi:multidrug ABC transporter permease [Leuconostoc gelidum subsp. aenigmaticum]|uniref:multidrug ABC transporter permease n=1 Tax=Leuconostoc gelidum TaxID=1244 RepID=UPI001CC3FE9D|nr:multidrug ABC transporter permease [Leuconostoc gelidum]MBZ6003862.1 multidrug ABC transporter permease [Leuconostoc gelidum subsp. aenigmaticum]